MYNTYFNIPSAYTTINERSHYYGWVDKQVSGVSRWFAAAEIVTNSSGVGGAGLWVNLNILHDPTEAFLKHGNAFLFKYNMENAKELMETRGLSKSFVDADGNLISFAGLSGKRLDYALVLFEQTKVQEFIDQYAADHPEATMTEIKRDINKAMNGRTWLGEIASDPRVSSVIKSEFHDKGEDFDFFKFWHRVRLGWRMIDNLHKSEKSKSKDEK